MDHSTLRDLDAHLQRRKTGKHDRALLLIAECLRQGERSGKTIVAILKGLGFDGRHVGMMLTQNCGPSPDSSWWFRDAQGLYQLHAR